MFNVVWRKLRFGILDEIFGRAEKQSKKLEFNRVYRLRAPVRPMILRWGIHASAVVPRLGLRRISTDMDVVRLVALTNTRIE